FAENFAARQSELLCIVAENIAKLFGDGSQKQKRRYSSMVFENSGENFVVDKLGGGLFRDVKLHAGSEIAKYFYRRGIMPARPDRIGEYNRPLVDVESLRSQSIRDVGGSDRAEELIVFAGLARELERDAVEHLRLLLRSVELGGGLFCQRTTNAFESFHVAG